MRCVRCVYDRGWFLERVLVFFFLFVNLYIYLSPPDSSGLPTTWIQNTKKENNNDLEEKDRVDSFSLLRFVLDFL